METHLWNRIGSITPYELLSFGPRRTPPDPKPFESDLPGLSVKPRLPLGGLNVIIGPNGSGKSNLLDVIRLVRSLPFDMQEVIGRGGGAEEWVWKGELLHSSPAVLLTVHLGLDEVVHQVEFHADTGKPQQLRPSRERVALLHPATEIHNSTRLSDDKMLLADGELDTSHTFSKPDQSILAQFSVLEDDPAAVGLLERLAHFYAGIRLYDSWDAGRNSKLRENQPITQLPDRLREYYDDKPPMGMPKKRSKMPWVNEDYSNLAMVLSQMGDFPKEKEEIVNGLRELYEGFVNFATVHSSDHQSINIVFEEAKRLPIPMTRLSDGTLRYLALLAILYSPNPPPVVCIEEPELGLHPDIVSRLAKHLLAASERMQLIVTTHSDIVVDALTHVPESIIVCENVDGETQMNRLDPDAIKGWLENNDLGELWLQGHIRGVRW